MGIKKQKFNFFEKNVKIYHRLMRYPCFPASFSTLSSIQKVVHKVNERGKVICKTAASVEDFEKLLCVFFLIQSKKAKIYETKIEGDHDYIIAASVKFYDIFKNFNIKHDYNYILESFERLTNTTIIYDFVTREGKHEKIIVKPLFKILIENKYLTLYFFKFFYDACIQKSLQLDLAKFLQINKSAKNLYLFLQSNADKKEFTFDTVAERMIIKKDKYLLRNIMRALNDLKNKNAIRSFEVDKNKRKIIVSY